MVQVNAFRRNIAARRITEAVRAVGAIRRARASARLNGAARIIQRAMRRNVGTRIGQRFAARHHIARLVAANPPRVRPAPLRAPAWYVPNRSTGPAGFRARFIRGVQNSLHTGVYRRPRRFRGLTRYV